MLSLGTAFDSYRDPARGPTCAFTPQWRATVDRALARWIRHFGAVRPWDSITRADVQAYVLRRLQRVGPRQVEIELKALQAVANWLVRYAELDVKNPLRGWDWSALRRGHRPKRPRYTVAEVERLLGCAWDVDPRLGLFLELLWQTGKRGASVLGLQRSCVNRPRHPMPTLTIAPHGWVVIPARFDKNRVERLQLLTPKAKAALERGFRWHLRELEARYLGEGRDYPLFPSGKLRKGVARQTARTPLVRRQLLALLVRTERAAGIVHEPGRGFHGIRRLLVDRFLSEGATDAEIMEWFGWSSARMAHDYRSETNIEMLATLRALRERMDLA